MSTYKQAGVDKEEGYKVVSNIKDLVATTHSKHVLNGIGSFGAFYELGTYKNPVLVSGTDGVGTKLRIAIDVNQYETIGIDCVAMCVNDILCHGAKPLFFLDYLACGKLQADTATEIIQGIVTACKEVGASLIGGETAEMPGMYAVGDYDVAGFCVGIVEKEAIIDGQNIRKGNHILAIPSSGFHSNGFSLVRKIFNDFHEIWNEKPIYEELLKPTRLYGNFIFSVLEKFQINGIAHITGGGIIENIPRIIPEGLAMQIEYDSIRIPEIMLELQKRGNISDEEMFGSFNMGIGMVLVVPENVSEKIIQFGKTVGEELYKIGEIV